MALNEKDLKTHHTALFEAMTRAAAEADYKAELNRDRYGISLRFSTYNDGAVEHKKTNDVYNTLEYSEVLSAELTYAEYRKNDRFNRCFSLDAVDFLRELSAQFKRYGVDFMNIYSEELDKAIHEEMKANAE